MNVKSANSQGNVDLFGSVKNGYHLECH